jgi:hypothetical protein
MLAISTTLVVVGLVTIAVSDGFLMEFLRVSIAWLGGAATYLILSHRKDVKPFSDPSRGRAFVCCEAWADDHVAPHSALIS